MGEHRGYYGDIVGWHDGSTVTWTGAKMLSYGAALEVTPVVFDQNTNALATSLSWQGRRLDPSRFYYLRARYHEPKSGRFISADPLGHASSMSLHDYGDGDSVNNIGFVSRCLGR